jgi:hypothetical protein
MIKLAIITGSTRPERVNGIVTEIDAARRPVA